MSLRNDRSVADAKRAAAASRSGLLRQPSSLAFEPPGPPLDAPCIFMTRSPLMSSQNPVCRIIDCKRTREVGEGLNSQRFLRSCRWKH